VPDLIEALAVEVGRAFSPLVTALEDEEELALFLRSFGITFPSGELSGALGELTSLRDGARAIAEATEDAVENGFTAADIAALFEAARQLFTSLRGLPSMFSAIVPAGMTPATFAATLSSLPDELLDYLLAEYLNKRAPLAAHLLNLLDVYRPQTIAASERGLIYVRHTFDWSRLCLLFDDPERWARAAYNWGVDLDSDELIWRLARFIELLGGVVHIEELGPAEVSAFLPGWPDPASPPTMARAPFIRKQVVNDDGTIDAAASGEAGLALFPVAGKSPPESPADRGIAAGPFLDGEAGASAELGAGLSARVTGDLGAVGGVVFALRPSGIAVETGLDATAFSGAFAMELTKRPADGSESVRFFGRPDGTRMEADAVTASFGGEISNIASDLYLAGGVRDLKLVIDPSDDGLLGALVSRPIEVTAGDILLGWRQGRGIYFESGSNLTVTVPLGVDVGPISLDEVRLALDWRQPPAVTAALTGDLAIGPFHAHAEGIGIKATIVEDSDGVLGNHDLSFGFKPPEAYALSLETGPITGGGFIGIYEHEYRGTLALRLENIGFSAFALLNTRLPNGERGFSLAASMFGDYTLPLGYGFLLTGIGGIIGVNRTVDTAAMREALFDGRLDNLLFPAAPIVDAAAILEAMAAILPPRQGQHLLGPVARIVWGKPVMVEVKLGAVIESGRQLRLLVLGALSSNLPTKDSALVSLNMPFFGEVDFAAGTISFDATLQNSRLLAWSISGDAALRTGWAPRLDHVASIGGLHPSYPRPPSLPDLRRVSINLGTNNPKITMNAYLARTLNTLQFGARADLYARGPKIFLVGRLAAEGHVYLDALVYFNPFEFDAYLGGSLSLLVDGDVVAGLGFDLRLRGPNPYRINGKVWITVFGIDVDFPINHTWGDPLALVAAIADAVQFLREAITRNARLEPVAATARISGVSLASGKDGDGAIDPGGGARIVQRAVPLGIRLARIGDAQVVGPRTLELKVFGGTSQLSARPQTEEFVRGHFVELSAAERLRSPEFERFRAGYELAPDVLVVDAEQAIEESYGYEVILIGDEDDRTAPAPIGVHVALSQAFTDRWVEVHQRRAARPREGFRARPGADAITLREVGFVPDVAADVFSSRRPPTAMIAVIHSAAATFTEAAFPGEVPTGAARARGEANRVVAGYVAAAQI
jgi:hypothetical protein